MIGPGRVRVRAAATAGLLLTLVLAGCGSNGAVGRSVLPSISPPGPPLRYVAIGASETVGIGADDPLTEAWPQLFYRVALPRAAVFVNLGIPGATVQDALSQEVPDALALRPDVVTVWLNVNDLLHGVDPAAYEAGLTQLLTDLRGGGRTQVLVANTPPLDRLPAYVRCSPFAPGLGGSCDRSIDLPPSAVRSAVDAYNAAIGRAAGRTGAVVVDLHALGLAARADGTEAHLISRDGFHPSDAGHVSVALAFATAYQRLR